jgi:putative solute:sodium symporter small subunit
MSGPSSNHRMHSPPEETGTSVSSGEIDEARVNEYWRKNVNLMLVLLGIWFAVSFGAGILFVDQLNAIKLGGAPLGFWFAQQGSIYVFVGLIIVYGIAMHKIEQDYHIDDDQG